MLLFCQLVLAQDPFYINYSTSEGLPSSMVYSVFRDDKNFLWFTTDAGVAKYDSHSFTLFNTDNGLSDNEVFQMKRDHQGRVWFLTLNGKLCYLYKDKLYNEQNSPFLKKLSGSNILMDYFEDDEQNGYFTFRLNRVSVLKKDGSIEKRTTYKGSFAGGWKDGKALYMLADLGIYDINSKRPLLEFDKAYPTRIFRHSGHVFFNKLHSLYEVKSGNRIEQILTLPEVTEIIQMYRENENKLWICTRDGVFLYENHTFRKFFSGYIVSSMTKDFEGGYWLTTLRNGVLYVPSFEVYETKPSDEKLKLNCISISPKNEIWIGSDRDEYYVKPPDGDFKTYQLPRITLEANEVNNIRFFEGRTYIANKSFLTVIEANASISRYRLSMNDVLIDDDFMYLGASSIYRIPKNKLHFLENYRFVRNASCYGLTEHYEFIRKRATVFCKGEKDDVWLGSNSGLYHVNSKTGEITSGVKNDDLLFTNVQDLFYDQSRQLLFVASSSKGVMLLKNNRIVKMLSKVNGLNSNSCNSIKKLPDNRYLIGTNNGLNLLSLDGGNYRITNLNSILGLKNKKINGIEYLDERVYVIAEKSLLHFDIKNINRKKTLPICHIENLSANGKLIESGDYCFSSEDNDISINYVGISYVDQNLIYYYKLDGKHAKWATSKETQINYRSLPPGKYCFNIYCMNGLGLKSKIKTVNFEILPAFWQQTWFAVLAILLFSLLVYWFIRYRLRLQRKNFETEKAIIQNERDKVQLEKEMIDLEQKALRLQMNPHFIFNALNTIKGYYSEGDAINASNYISKFSKLLRMLLENTDQSIPLAKEIEMLELYITLAQTRYKNKFTYELFVDDNLNRNETAIPTLLLQPIVENAIIHGLAPKEETGLLKVSFVKKGEMLECIIEDNGIGREASKTSQENKIYESKAIQITNERIALFSENAGKPTFEIIDLKNNSVSAGTKVIITIPLISIW